MSSWCCWKRLCQTKLLLFLQLERMSTFNTNKRSTRCYRMTLILLSDILNICMTFSSVFYASLKVYKFKSWFNDRARKTLLERTCLKHDSDRHGQNGCGMNKWIQQTFVCLHVNEQALGTSEEPSIFREKKNKTP